MKNPVFAHLARYAGAVAATMLLIAGTSGCGKEPPPKKKAVVNKYDEAKMDFSPPPSKVTQTRPPTNGTGASTSIAPAMPVLDDSTVREVRLDATNKVIELAPGVRFSGWTFGDTIPGPVVRARVGDRVKFVMTNRTDEVIGGVNMGMPMPHSMDFHSAMVSPQDKYRSITPGETIEFEFVANYPGVYMYHCGTPPILEHIAAGMYGMMVVDPKGGYPTKVDREYAVVQSEFYLKPDPQKRTVGEDPLYVIDMERAMEKRPTQVVFNGRVTGMVEKPLVAKPGEHVRLFVLNVGPSDTSSFHVVGTIFDRVYLEGNPDNKLRGMQTHLLGASSGMIAEFRIPERGKYIMVDHEFADASKGAVGLIDATGPVAGSDAQLGEQLYRERCMACHAPPPGTQRMAPEIAGATKRHNDEWLLKWLTRTPEMLATDETAKALLKQWNNVPMPTLGTSETDAKRIIEYLHSIDKTGTYGEH